MQIAHRVKDGDVIKGLRQALPLILAFGAGALVFGGGAGEAALTLEQTAAMPPLTGCVWQVSGWPFAGRPTGGKRVCCRRWYLLCSPP